VPNKFTRADKEVTDLAKEIITEHCEELGAVGVTFDILMAHAPENDAGEKTGPALKLHGYPCGGIISIQSLKNRVIGSSDALILLDADQWQDMEENDRKALLHHELHHVTISRDVEGGVIYDTHGRPKLKLRLHDVQVGWFTHIAKIYKEHSGEVQDARKIFDQHGNTLFPFLGQQELPKLQASSDEPTDDHAKKKGKKK
jgi:hypothetical protein